MEDSAPFDAGRGSYYTRAGVPEMDAAPRYD
jgi:isoaspartyl peptidase/L-asparaginase-like protein (Ntn-hydrolase superfamily)